MTKYSMNNMIDIENRTKIFQENKVKAFFPKLIFILLLLMTTISSAEVASVLYFTFSLTYLILLNGKIQIEMEAPDGTFYKYLGIVQEIINNEKLVFTTKLVDTHGKPLVETLNTIHFSQAKDFAVLTLHAKNVLATEMGREFLNSQEESWLSSFEKLEALLSK